MNKKNLPLYIALSIPLLMILLVAAFVYFPGLGKTPKYNFLYMSGDNVYYGNGTQAYQIQNGHITQNAPFTPVPTPPNYYQPPAPQVHFYVYDVATNVAKEITFQEAQGYNLDNSSTSSDGYVVQQGNGGGGDLFFGGVSGDYSSWFIKGHNRSKKLNIKFSGGANYYNFQFLGWIE